MKLTFILSFLILYSLFFIPHPVSASTTLYFGSIEKTYDDSGAVTEEKVYYPAGNSTVVKSTDYGLQTTDSLSFLHSDHLGSTVLVTDNSGNKIEDNQYYSYGEPIIHNPPASPAGRQPITDRLYTGQRKDSSTDLYYYNARYYNPKIGHFISADKAEGSNRYAYVGNNPVMRNDPTGNQGGIGGLLQQYCSDPLSCLQNGINLVQKAQVFVNTLQPAQSQEQTESLPQPIDNTNNSPIYLPVYPLQETVDATVNLVLQAGPRGGAYSYDVTDIKYSHDFDRRRFTVSNTSNNISIQPDAGKQSNSANKLKAYYLTVPQQKRNVLGKDFNTSPYVTYRGVIPEYSGTNYDASACSGAGGSPMSAQNACQGELNHAFSVMKDDPRSSQSLKDIINMKWGVGTTALTAMGMGECQASVPANGCYSSRNNERFDQVVLDEKQSEQFTQQHPELIPQ